MKILQICSARQIGGGERHLADLSNALQKRGHEVFYTFQSDSPVKNLIENAAPENFLLTKMRNALDVFAARKIAEFITQNDIEIVHAHIAKDYPIAARAARISGKPFVLTRHVLFPLKRLQKYALRNVGGIIAPSNAVAESLKKQNLFPAEIIQTIHNGIDLTQFADLEKIGNAKFTIGTIGHLAPIKGHDIFIRAAAEILQKRQDFKFVIVGEDKSDSGENRRKLENLIAKLNLQNYIELAGWTDDVRPFLQQFDLFVSTARSEPFGLVIAEALAAQIPVVATESEGATEIIEDGKSGVLIPLDNPARLTEAILDLAFDNQKRERLKIAGRQRVDDNFSLKKMVAETEIFYQRILRNNR